MPGVVIVVGDNDVWVVVVTIVVVITTTVVVAVVAVTIPITLGIVVVVVVVITTIVVICQGVIIIAFHHVVVVIIITTTIVIVVITMLLLVVVLTVVIIGVIIIRKILFKDLTQHSISLHIALQAVQLDVLHCDNCIEQAIAKMPAQRLQHVGELIGNHTILPPPLDFQLHVMDTEAAALHHAMSAIFCKPRGGVFNHIIYSLQ